MGYYAAFLDVGGKPCLVIGGDHMAADKARGLHAAGAEVRMIWPEFGADAQALRAPGVTLLAREFDESDLDGCFLAIDASGDDERGPGWAAAARARRVLLNVLDRPARCDFIAPALVQRGPLQIAVSTAGRSPFMASHLRRRLESESGTEWGQLVELVGELRDGLRREGVSLEVQSEIYGRIPNSGALELLERGDNAGARTAIAACRDGLSG
jgi:precorrin-2 dehydrogenase/sirohydrochlorin ferrochelatase